MRPLLKHPLAALGVWAITALTPRSLQAQVAPVPFRVTLEARAVVIDGITAKGRVALVGLTRTVGEDDFPEVRTFREWLEDDDGDGTVRLEVKRPFPHRTIFLAVDGESGKARVATLAKFGLRRVGWRGDGVVPGDIGKVREPRSVALVMLVRPKVGAWAILARDGGEQDEDGQVDSGMEVAIDKLESLADSPQPPLSYEPTDILILIDPTGLEFTVAKGDGSLVGGLEP